MSQHVDSSAQPARLFAAPLSVPEVLVPLFAPAVRQGVLASLGAARVGAGGALPLGAGELAVVHGPPVVRGPLLAGPQGLLVPAHVGLVPALGVAGEAAALAVRAGVGAVLHAADIGLCGGVAVALKRNNRAC